MENLKKFRFSIIKCRIDNVDVEAKDIYDAIRNFRMKNSHDAINKIEYVYEGDEPLQDWYCIWWNENTWKSKIVKAHCEDEIIYNIKDSLDYCVYNFLCCKNDSKSIDSLHRSIWD